MCLDMGSYQKAGRSHMAQDHSKNPPDPQRNCPRSESPSKNLNVCSKAAKQLFSCLSLRNLSLRIHAFTCMPLVLPPVFCQLLMVTLFFCSVLFLNTPFCICFPWVETKVILKITEWPPKENNIHSLQLPASVKSSPGFEKEE